MKYIRTIRMISMSCHLQVLIGLLRLPPEDMHRRGKTEGQSVQERQVTEFKSGWSGYDWTKQLD